MQAWTTTKAGKTEGQSMTETDAINELPETAREHARSEERRVGKERAPMCRSRCSPSHEKKTKQKNKKKKEDKQQQTNIHKWNT